MESASFAIKNAQIVLRDHVLERGWVAIGDGIIAAVGKGQPQGEQRSGNQCQKTFRNCHETRQIRLLTKITAKPNANAPDS